MSAPTPEPPVKTFDRRYDPFRTADWRWQRAGALIAAGLRPDRTDDTQTRAVYRYRKALGRTNCPNRPMRGTVFQSWPALVSAHRLCRCELLRDEIQARLLAGEDFPLIASQVGISPEVLCAYEAVFFNVTDALNARDWLLENVLAVHTWSPKRLTQGQTWAWAALAGGPLLLNLLIADDMQRPIPNFPNRPRFAEIARLLALEAVTPLASSVAAYSLMVKLERLLRRPRRGQSASQRVEQTKIRLHLRILRLAARKQTGVRKPRKVVCREKVTKAATKSAVKVRRKARRPVPAVETPVQIQSAPQTVAVPGFATPNFN